MSPCCPSKACARQSCCGLLAAAAVPHFEICVLKIQTERQQFCAEAEQFLSIPPCDHNFRAAQCATEGLCTRCHACPLWGSTQHVTQVSATYSSFPDIALNPQAPPSRCGQILIDSFWGSPIANRTQWVADRSSIGSLFNHPFVVEIRVLVFNACCKDRLRNSTIITHLYGYYSILYMKTCITQIFTYYANIAANKNWTCNGLGTHLCCNLALRMRHHGLRWRGPLIGIVPLALHPKLVCNLWGLCTAIQVDDVAPFQNLRCCMYDEMDLTSAHDVNPLAVGEGEQLCALIHEGRAQGVK